ncbi:MAG: DUF4153 domain-containing protein [Clostridia bacterium]|nr:DUF4153 domain-containing protein [Clostridia bacterium]
MKISFQTGKITRKFWRQFLPSALCCVLLVLISIGWEITFRNYEFSTPVYEKANQWHVTLQGMLVTALGFATAAVCLRKKYAFPAFIPWLAAVAGAGLGFLCRAEFALAGFAVASAALSCHGILPKENRERHFCRVLGTFFVSMGIAAVVYVAVTLCSEAVFSLLFSSAAYWVRSFVTTLGAIICFVLIAPWLFLGGLPEADEEKESLFRKFCSYVLLPIYLVLVAILLLYVGKMLITLQMPVGEMNPYAILTLTGFVGLHLSLTGEENKLSRWFKKWGGYFLIPVVVAQGIGVYIRAAAYGLTGARILGMVWTAVCVAVLAWKLFGKNIRWFFPAVACAALFFFCTPLNAQNLAVWNQEARLEAALVRNDMLDEQGRITANPNAEWNDRKIIWSAVEYLNQADAREGSLTARLQAQQKELAEKEETDSYPRFWGSPAIKTELLGFAKPVEKETWYSRSYDFVGSAHPTMLDTRGYDYARYVNVEQYADDDGIKEIVCDLPMLLQLAEESHLQQTPLKIPGMMELVIDGEKADLAVLLNGLVCSREKDVPLVEDKITFPSGKVFHVDRLSLIRYHREDEENIDGYVRLSGWLMTPEAE